MTATDLPGTDLDRIFRVLLPRAREALIASDGRLTPLGATLDNQGELHAAVTVEGAEPMQPPALLERMLASFEAQACAGRIKACGVCYDARVEGPAGAADAIATRLEHQNGESAVIYLPYVRTGGGAFEFGSLIPASETRRVWR